MRTWRKLTGIVAASVLALSVIGGGTATAKVPGWGFTIVPTPSVVRNGANAGYVVTITNGGKSNISALYLATDIPSTDANSSPTYISAATYAGPAGPANPCNPTGPLNCTFGNLVSGASVTLTIAFTTPASGANWSFNFLAFGNGNTPSDGGTSHGDTLKGPASVTLSSSKNFDGGFTLDGLDFSTDTSLSKKNPQSSAVTPPVANIAVTIEDGIAAFPGSGADPCVALHCIGDWAKLNVNNGQSGPVRIVLVLYGPSVPNGATVDNIKLWHEGSVPNPITTHPCDATTLPVVPGGAECITVTKVGNNFQIVAWLARNGSVRGAY